jgi:integrase
LRAILNFAEVKEFRPQNTNPLPVALARLKPIRSIHKIKHHEALPWQQAGMFIKQIRDFRYTHGSEYLPLFHLLKEAGGTMTHQQIASAMNTDLHHSTNLVNRLVARGSLIRVERGVFRLGRDDVPNYYGVRPLLTYAIDFLLLTAVRSEMVTHLPWSEIYHVPERNRVLWICPPERHKTGGSPHVVPLSRQAIAILDDMHERQQAANMNFDYVFVYTPATRPPSGTVTIGEPIYKTSLIQFIQRTLSGWPNITVHGFRTTFGDWSVENDYSERDSEMALGHAVEPQTISRNLRSIYKRNAHRIEQRLIMMQGWADFLDKTDQALPAQIVPFNQRRRNI